MAFWISEVPPLSTTIYLLYIYPIGEWMNRQIGDGWMDGWKAGRFGGGLMSLIVPAEIINKALEQASQSLACVCVCVCAAGFSGYMPRPAPTRREIKDSLSLSLSLIFLTLLPPPPSPLLLKTLVSAFFDFFDILLFFCFFT